jgi:hypothetical protein
MALPQLKPSEQERIDMPLTSSGYVYEKLPMHPLSDNRGRVLQHRRVWFDSNGTIPEGGVIHHINGKKTDNRLENLELCDRSSHMKEHYPNGFWFEGWNKGKAEYSNVSCQECGIGFVRLAKEVRKTLKRGSRVLCRTHCGKDKGWTLHKSGKYQAQYKGKYLGLFVTQQEAKAAFDRARGNT